ncbi:unnamed protein product [Peniophora sp. CBMAI 1063]|nr:unnamed protein product [Peniophora sp. CBMAI 1063]
METVMDPDLWKTARGILNDAPNRGHLAFTPLLSQRLTSTPLTSVSTVDVFLPRQHRLDGNILAPSLHSISIRSDAAETSQCPVPASILMDIFETSVRLRYIHLRRCVDTTSIGDLPSSGRHRRLLSKLDIGCMDESLLRIIHYYFVVDSSSSVSIDLYSTSQLSRAMTLCFDDFKLDRESVTSMGIFFDHEYATGDDGHDLFRTYFFGLRLYPLNDFVVILRMDETHQTWSWQNFTELFPCQNITSLTLRNRQSFESVTEVRPGYLLSQLHGLETVTVADRPHIDCLTAIPLTSPISTIIIAIPGAADNEDLADVWHWLKERGKSDRNVQLLLSGKLQTAEELERYRRIEAPVISALQQFATVEDDRSFVKGHVIRIYHN